MAEGKHFENILLGALHGIGIFLDKFLPVQHKWDGFLKIIFMHTLPQQTRARMQIDLLPQPGIGSLRRCLTLCEEEG